MKPSRITSSVLFMLQILVISTFNNVHPQKEEEEEEENRAMDNKEENPLFTKIDDKTCPLSKSSTDSEVSSALSESSSYGVDVSWPMHYNQVSINYPWLPHFLDSEVNIPNKFKKMPLQVLGNRQRAYDVFIQGCFDAYSQMDCMEAEQERLHKNRHQISQVRNFTQAGYDVVSVPTRLVSRVRGFWNKYKKFRVLEEDEGDEVIVDTIINDWENPVYFLDINNIDALPRQYRDLSHDILKTLHLILNKWVDKKSNFAHNLKLAPVQTYGIREYTKGAILSSHVDDFPRILSAVINIDQDHSWPLEIINHDGIAKNISLDIGEALLYESHSIIHGRPFAFQGNTFANLFVHFLILNESPLKPTASLALQRDYLYQSKLYLLFNEAHAAATFGEVDKLVELSDINATLLYVVDEDGWTTLHRASVFGHIDVVQYLLDMKVDVTAKTNKNETALELALVYLDTSHNEDVVDLLQNATKKTMTTILKSNNNKKKSIAHEAASNNNLQTLQEIAKSNHTLLFEIDDRTGFTPLMEAAIEAHLECMTFLLEQGADLSIRNHYGQTAMDLSKEILSIQLEIETLLQKTFEGIVEQSLLFRLAFSIDASIASTGSDLSQSKKTMTNYEQDEIHQKIVDAVVNDDVIAFMIIMEHTSSTYVDTNFIISKPDHNGWTPLHEAVRAGSIKCITLLLELGADKTIRTNSGDSALDMTKKYIKQYRRAVSLLERFVFLQGDSWKIAKMLMVD